MPVRLIYIILFCFILIFSCKIRKPQGKERIKTQNVKSNSIDKVQSTAMLIDGKKESLAGNYEEAIKQLKKSISLNQDNAAAKYELANIYVMQNHLNEATILLKKAIELEPKNEWYSLQLAKIFEYKGQYSNATKIYETLIKQNSNKADYYEYLANSYLYAKK